MRTSAAVPSHGRFQGARPMCVLCLLLCSHFARAYRRLLTAQESMPTGNLLFVLRPLWTCQCIHLQHGCLPRSQLALLACLRLLSDCPKQIEEAYEQMKAEKTELVKAVAALEGIEGWTREVEQLEMVGGPRMSTCPTPTRLSAPGCISTLHAVLQLHQGMPPGPHPSSARAGFINVLESAPAVSSPQYQAAE